ncbi:MAG TPA: disulfide oxidoreductase [Thermoanaerobaculia bacterium]|nr:disulfide oxidoreductase [Thermoanaerobaculia bacterium]
MFESRTIVADALAMHPKARWVFAAYHLGGCNACNLAHEETLEQLAVSYGLSLDALLGDLNSLFASAESQSLRGSAS